MLRQIDDGKLKVMHRNTPKLYSGSTRRHGIGIPQHVLGCIRDILKGILYLGSVSTRA